MMKSRATVHASPRRFRGAKHKVDIVFECTGKFTDKEGASRHLKAGAKKVLVSAPCKGEDLTVVYGVNHSKLKATDKIISNASCTTNCLGPVAYVLNKAIGIEHGFMTTIHSYTGDQVTVDASHKDPYRARAAALNLIPTSTGAAKAIGKVLPELEGKLDGVSIRVPTPNVSLVDFKFTAKRKTTVEEINDAMKKAASGELKNIRRGLRRASRFIRFQSRPALGAVRPRRYQSHRWHLCPRHGLVRQ
jgi:glyceraldehyde 3-phosphate dehydrogenase